MITEQVIAKPGTNHVFNGMYAVPGSTSAVHPGRGQVDPYATGRPAEGGRVDASAADQCVRTIGCLNKVVAVAGIDI